MGLTYRKLIAILGVVIPILRRWNDLLEVFIQGRSFDCTYMAALYCRFTLTGTKVTVCAINYGCAITSIFAPDNKGVTDDIVLGYDNVAGKHLGKKHYANLQQAEKVERTSNCHRYDVVTTHRR